MIDINLLPDAILGYRREQKIKQTATYAVIGASGVLIALTAGALLFRGITQARLSSAEKTKTAVDAEVNSAENVAFREEAIAVQESLTNLSSLFGNQSLPTELLGALAKLTPKSTQVTELSMDAGGTLNISGSAIDFEGVSKFIAALKQSKTLSFDEATQTYGAHFIGTILNGVTVDDDGNKLFEITVVYTPSAKAMSGVPAEEPDNGTQAEEPDNGTPAQPEGLEQ